MLHDGNCERSTTIIKVGMPTGLSPGEREAMLSVYMVPMVACRCHSRAMGRAFQTTDAELRQQTRDWIYKTRGRRMGGIVAAIAVCRMKVEGSSSLTAAELLVSEKGGLRLTSGELGKVIRVDFEKRERID